MKLKQSFLFSCIFSLIGIASWELYWRDQGVLPSLNDDKHLWAMHRAKVDCASESDVVIIGSSRALFDIQLDVWQDFTGVKPIQLASAGCTPLPAMRDIVENTDFKGTLVVGVTPGLFFSTTNPMAPPVKRMNTRIDFFRTRTYAQRLNYFVSIPLEQNFSFMSMDEEEWDDDINLKNLLSKIKIGERIKSSPKPPFNRFQDIGLDRNVRMNDKTVTDTAFANSIKKVWKFFTPEDRKSDKAATMAYFLEDAKKFLDRGGNLILVRCPSEGYLREIEMKNQPREEYWDELVKNSGAKAYHFEDYAQLQGFHIPEWSHLAPTDADAFTMELVKILLADTAISKKVK
jgi:hypothetical protein